MAFGPAWGVALAQALTNCAVLPRAASAYQGDLALVCLVDDVASVRGVLPLAGERIGRAGEALDKVDLILGL